MLAGVVGVAMYNYKCSDVTTSTTKFEAVDGFFTLQKVFIDAFSERPMGLAGDVKHESNLCTLYTAVRRDHTYSNVQGTGQSVTQALSGNCVMPPDEFLDYMKFPPAFYFCDLSSVPDALTTIFIGLPNIPNMVVGKQYNPKEFFHLIFDALYPGWRCGPNGAYASAVPALASHCSNIDTSIVYNYCGWSVDFNEPIIWPDYKTYPSGTMSWYSHGYITSEKYTSTICTSLTGSIGAAIGYIGYIEMIATMLLVTVLVGIGVAKPLNEKATLGTMFKGAGMAAIAEEIEKQKIHQENKVHVDKKTIPYNSLQAEELEKQERSI